MKITNMENMFVKCIILSDLQINKDIFQTENILDMEHIFYNWSLLS